MLAPPAAVVIVSAVCRTTARSSRELWYTMLGAKILRSFRMSLIFLLLSRFVAWLLEEFDGRWARMVFGL